MAGLGFHGQPDVGLNFCTVRMAALSCTKNLLLLYHTKHTNQTQTIFTFPRK